MKTFKELLSESFSVSDLRKVMELQKRIPRGYPKGNYYTQREERSGYIIHRAKENVGALMHKDDHQIGYTTHHRIQVCGHDEHGALKDISKHLKKHSVTHELAKD